jgi:hypothetical protein
MDWSLRGAPATKQSSVKKDWIASLALAMTSNFEQVSAFPQGNYLRVVARIYPPKDPRAQGMPGADAPADGVTGLLALRAVVPHMMV